MEKGHDHEHGDYAEGQEEEHAGGAHHEGSFAEGQADEEKQHGRHGDFAEGQEQEHDESRPEGSFADEEQD